MKVLLKSFKELEEEYGVDRFMDSYIILYHVVYPEMIKLLGKIVEAEYDKMSDSYIINAWYYYGSIILYRFQCHKGCRDNI